MICPKNKLDYFPIWRELKDYSWKKAKADFQAGLNVSLLDFPQAMAYALLAGFPVMFGIYASAIASIVGPIFASSRYVILGATNATAVLLLSSFLTLDMTMGEKLIALPIVVLMVGLFMLIGAFLKLAGLIKYVSRTVITGYISAAALLIIVNQLSTILGTPDVKASTFFEVFSRNIEQWDQIQWVPVFIAATTALVYLFVNRFLKPIPRVAVTLVFSGIMALGLSLAGVPVDMIDAGAFGHWPLSIPSFDFEMISQMGSVAAAIAFLAVLESSSIAKTLAARSGQTIDLNQHMFSMGIANVACSLGSGMPASGSLTRSMLNYAGGAKTSLSSVFNGLLLVAGILVLGPLVGYIPKAGLATIVIFVGLSLINFEHIRVVIRSTNSDAAVFCVTFIGGLLFPLTMAISLGAAASIILFLRKISEPHLVQYTFTDDGQLAEQQDGSIHKETPEISIIHVEGELFFGSSDIFLDQTRFICESPNLKVIILRVRKANHLDATSAMAMGDLIRFAQEKHRHVIVSGANKQVEKVFREAGVMDLLGEENFFAYSPLNPNLCTRNALKRAREIIGQDPAKVILFSAAHKDAQEEDENQEDKDLISEEDFANEEKEEELTTTSS